MKKQDDYRKVLNRRREKLKRTKTSFYSAGYLEKDNRFNIDLKRPSFGGPGVDLCGPHVSFGATKRAVELEKER